MKVYEVKARVLLSLSVDDDWTEVDAENEAASLLFHDVDSVVDVDVTDVDLVQTDEDEAA